jgi:hypothetical protein
VKVGYLDSPAPNSDGREPTGTRSVDRTATDDLSRKYWVIEVINSVDEATHLTIGRVQSPSTLLDNCTLPLCKQDNPVTK